MRRDEAFYFPDLGVIEFHVLHVGRKTNILVAAVEMV